MAKETPVLDATARTESGKGAARRARKAGLVPGVIYGGNKEPIKINVKFNELLKRLHAGKFLSTLIDVIVDGEKNHVICRGVQRDVVKDLPTHVDFLRLGDKSRVSLMIPVEFINEETCPGIKRGGVLTIVRNEVELRVTAGNIPDHLTVDLAGKEVGDTIHISEVDLPKGTRPTIDRDFVIGNIQAPSSLRSEDDEEAGDEAEAAEETAEASEE
ncbi:50S ribosomal protein L25/general stress protein Ctc [Amaricoccus tamworthensis]|uniref:50S ribosomal protein L25/general stress protein Ctc n=1 Tax=Amaricoccus tamworthensis TaxID=57002 RepID=UPI003C7E4554